ncbi:MAG: ATP-binding protein [Candidatus Methanoplasma sp.]|jgi:predicted AAA+ superfamily ATPase|nr:ATP-binding protein [Candidatus Methanoplasma sp.]
MERKIAAKLLKWKSDPDRKPLLLCGARQVGKTYTALDFGHTHYRNVAYFNFEFTGRASKIFEGDLDTGRIVDSLSVLSGVDIKEGDTLIVLDEIQACNRALTSLKYFRENDPGYHVMATGSLLGIALDRDGFSFPVGNVNIMRMHPMDIEEFMWATGDKKVAEGVRRSFSSQRKYDLHDRAMDVYRTYLTVGGLPEAVKRYSEGASAPDITAIHAEMDATYMGDMSKYTTKTETVMIRAIWSSISDQLVKENKRFVLRDVAEGTRTREAGSPLNWLRVSGLVNRCGRISTGTMPLSAHSEEPFFKLYMVDSGLLASKLGIPAKTILSDSESLDGYKGALSENFVMQALRANGVKPYYWAPSPGREVDFVFQGSDGNAVPVEVKSSSHVRSRSLSVFAEEYGVPFSIRVSTKNFGFENKIFNVPLYAAFCLDADVCDIVGEEAS